MNKDTFKIIENKLLQNDVAHRLKEREHFKFL